ncbi:lysophospholipid acyltransferase family protein [Streptomyces sp. NRRL F-2664]|uniref:lysophospholipid acyltransferase family protein n=1 Tax=Streptomyces sp. NRRL F-2664 TaxID=1463842 RepID=UPI0004C8579C|nr:lysophospholipid acyltransferase family protein [Streptomyces sp. NRRL F-2664]
MLRMLLRRLLLIPLKLVLRPRVSGVENVPDSGPFIIAANHLSFFDSIFVALLTPRRLYFIGKQGWLEMPGLKGRLQGLFFRAVGMVSVDGTSGSATMAGLETSLRILREGDGIGVHIEGTRSPDGRLYKGNTGTAWLALRSGAPVVPCGLTGTERVHPAGAKRLHVARFDVRFGAPMTFPEHAGRADDRRVRRSVTDRITQEISALTGQEYVDMYAATVKSRAAAESRAAAASPE